jgi:molybdenum-dependent DNA-binding transcriptional regulator ModE
MANKLPNGNERFHGNILEMVKQGQKTLKMASLELGMSYRQAKRVYRRYREGGDEALIHGNTGKPSNRRTGPALVRQALSLYAEKYDDFGPTLACEKLAERDSGDRCQHPEAGADSCRVVEAETERQRILLPAGDKGTFWGIDAIRRQPSRLI